MRALMTGRYHPTRVTIHHTIAAYFTISPQQSLVYEDMDDRQHRADWQPNRAALSHASTWLCSSALLERSEVGVQQGQDCRCLRAN
jgi:hypothetical protein